MVECTLFKIGKYKHKTAKLVVNFSLCVFFLFVQFNPLLRDIFGLGPPLILDASVKGNKISRFEKVTASPLSLTLLTCTLEQSGLGVCDCIFLYLCCMMSNCCGESSAKSAAKYTSHLVRLQPV